MTGGAAVIGCLQHRRAFNDSDDLNRVMPGRENGNPSGVYAYRFITRIVRQFQYEVAKRVEKDRRLALLTNLFGDVIREFRAPENAIVVGASSNPVAQTGARIVHLGIEGRMA